MLSVQDVLGRIAEMHKNRSLYSQPLWRALVDGTLSRAQVREFAYHYSIVPVPNNNYHGRLYVHCPDWRWRRRIAEICYEEGTGRLYSNGKPHCELYFDFAGAFGWSERELVTAEYMPVAQAWKAYFERMCESSFLKGATAHMLSGEAMIPGTFGRIADQLQKKFDLTDDQVAFWRVHDVADGDHSDIGRELLEQYAPTEADRELVLRTVDAYKDVVFQMYAAIYDRVRSIH
ncbi:MAG: iron-containing redox enzyme family protein [Alphaproteobacteria bacterium]|nr:iron-containing redox enzyme family protein [Alphaproteobacteria bacterium]